MARPLKVYGSSPFGQQYVPETLSPHRQTRHIVAAPSLAAACRLLGTTREYTSETRNEKEIAVAMAAPGVVFWPADRLGDRFERVPMGNCRLCGVSLPQNLWRCETCRKGGR